MAARGRYPQALRALFRVLPVALLAVGCIAGCAQPPQVPTAVVEERDFVHRVSVEGVLQPVERTMIAVPFEVQGSVRLAWLAEDGAVVEEGDVVARFDRLPMDQRGEDGRDSRAVAINRIARVGVLADDDLEGLAKDFRVADLELSHAERYLRTDDLVFSRKEIVEDAIDQELAQDRKDHARQATEVRREIADKDRQVLTIEQQQAEREIVRAEAGLAALEVRAPQAGVLTLKRSWSGEPLRVGAEVWQGQELAEMPHTDAMEAEVWVLEADAGGLEAGLAADVVVEAHPERSYAARVERVEALAKPKRRGSPVQYFGVTLTFESTDTETMKPGGRLRATLSLAEREAALVVPRQAVARRGEEPGVWVRGPGGLFELRPVELGPVSPGLAVIEGGLERGDVVALAPPPPSLRQGPSGSRPSPGGEEAS
ncbi:MAG: HlyD family efflux transporter periplasmic adaptor subunit [Acidobacteriota bacterium]